MDYVSTNFTDEKEARKFAKIKAKFNARVEKMNGYWRVVWDIQPIKNEK